MQDTAINQMKNDRYNVVLAISLFLLIAVLIPGWGIFRKSQLDNASQQLAVNTVQTVFSANNSQFLVENAHESYLLEMSEESLSKYITSTQYILGLLISIDAIRGSSDASFNPLSRGTVTANYEVDLTFANVEATAELTMIYQQGRWRFTAFAIQSPALID